MSLKRSHASGKSHFGGGTDPGAKLGRQELFDELKKLGASGQVFAPVDVSMAIGAGEPQVARVLLGLAAEGYLEKVEINKYRATQFGDLPQAEFLKALTRATKTDSARQRDLTEIQRLKQNNDIMRSRLLSMVAERDHYMAVLNKHGINPGPVPTAPAAGEGAAGPPASAAVSLPGTQESSLLPSGPGVLPRPAPLDEASSNEEGLSSDEPESRS